MKGKPLNNNNRYRRTWAKLDVSTIAVLIINYRVSRYQPALDELKREVSRYHTLPDSMPTILRAFALDEMQRDTPYQMPKGKRDMDIILRNKRIGHMIAKRHGTVENEAVEVADNLGMTENQIRNHYKEDKIRDKLLRKEWENILDPLSEAERKEILKAL